MVKNIIILPVTSFQDSYQNKDKKKHRRSNNNDENDIINSIQLQIIQKHATILCWYEWEWVQIKNINSVCSVKNVIWIKLLLIDKV